MVTVRMVVFVIVNWERESKRRKLSEGHFTTPPNLNPKMGPLPFSGGFEIGSKVWPD